MKKRNLLIKTFLIVLVAVLAFAAVVFAVSRKNGIRDSEKSASEFNGDNTGESEKVSDSEATGESEKVSDSEATGESGKEYGGSAAADENYYPDRSEKVIEVIDAATSKNVLSEAGVIDLLEKRGFKDCIIAYMDDIDGTHHAEEEITGDPSAKRPMYYAYISTKNDEVWTVYVINGKVMAYPVSYHLDRGDKADVIISETSEIISYDHDTNRFYVRIPNKSDTIVKVVDRIDAETLERLTVEEIEKYEY